MNEKKNHRSWAFTVAAVIMLAATCLVPMAANDSDGASTTTYDVYLAKGQTWTTSYSYTATLSPEARVLYSTSEISANSSGWSSATTNATYVSSGTDNSSSVFGRVALDTTNHTVNASIKIGASYTASTIVYVGVKLTTVNPSQSVVTVFKVHIISPSFTTGYAGGSFSEGTTISNQVPAVSLGNGNSYKTISYSISTAGGKTLTQNTGLNFDTSTGKISGTVSNPSNSSLTYTVTATMTVQSGYPASITTATTVTIGAYSAGSMTNQTAYAIKGTTNVNVAAPTTSGITYNLQSATYTLNGGSSNTITAGTAFNGITVANTGTVSGTPTVSGTYVITENYKVQQTNQSLSRTVTITVEDQVVVANLSTVNRYVGNATANSDIATASHTETNQVAGSWSLTDSSGKFQINPSNGKVTVKNVPAAGEYNLTVKYTSSASSTNNASKTFKVCVDANLVLTCSDADSTLYAATSSEALDNGQDSATMSQTGALYAGSKTVSYSMTSSTLTVGTDISISSAGAITIASSLNASKIGTHQVTVTCTDDAINANTASKTLTVVVVAAMVAGTPSVGTITSS